MATTWINSDNMLAMLQKQMNEEMMLAAAPVIEKAVAEAKKEMQKKLGAMFVAMIDQSFSVERFGSNLRITVIHDKGVEP